MARKYEYFLKEAMSYKKIDREQVKTRDLILADGDPYQEF